MLHVVFLSLSELLLLLVTSEPWDDENGMVHLKLGFTRREASAQSRSGPETGKWAVVFHWDLIQPPSGF